MVPDDALVAAPRLAYEAPSLYVGPTRRGAAVVATATALVHGPVLSDPAPQNRTMPILVEVNMHIPNITVPLEAHRTRVLQVRFLKTMTLDGLPNLGSSIDVTVKPDVTLRCTVTHLEWSEPREMFVVSCRYPRTRIAADEYQALAADTEWRRHEF
jgi:hypothetical protein